LLRTVGVGRFEAFGFRSRDVGPEWVIPDKGKMNAPDKSSRFDSPVDAHTALGVRIIGRRTFVFLSAALFALLLVWMLWPGAKTEAPAGRNSSLQPVPVATASTQRADIHVTFGALGAVTPLATVVVKPQASGILRHIDFREGQMVRAGDLLAEIDPRPYQALLDQAKGALARDQAQYENARVDLTRYQALWSQKAISQQQVATQEALVRTDAGNVEADRGAVEAAQVNLGFCRITSPVAGRVGLRQVDVGNYVQVGVTSEVVAVTQLQPISVLFTVPEDDLPALMQRVQSGAGIPVDAYDRAQRTKIATGRLSNMDNQVDPTTGTIKIRALFDNSDGRLFPGQFVNVKILVNTLHDQVAVPVAAIQHGASGDFVFLVGADRTVAMRTIALGPLDGDLVAIRRGLSPGDIVVVDGVDRLRDGSRVQIAGSRSPDGHGGTGGGHRRWHRSQSGRGGDGGL
jgi:multidrug efflux system membrane fusion protein